MTPHFLFPASPLNPRMIDEEFQDQAIALKQAGFGTSVLDMDGAHIKPQPEPGATCVYRGWMLSPKEYRDFETVAVLNRCELLASSDQYLAAHWLPNWYPLVEEFTVNSVVFSGESELMKRDLKTVADKLGEFVRSMQGLKKPPFNADNGLPWDKFQLKDYVKSLKTAGGSAFTTPEEILPILEKMEKYRGTIEGGVVIRQWEEFLPGTETRYFMVGGKYYGQQVAFDLRAMRILEAIKDKVPSPFYSVDIALRSADGQARIVEIGDGQVSDLVGWTPERFAEIWK